MTTKDNDDRLGSSSSLWGGKHEVVGFLPDRGGVGRNGSWVFFEAETNHPLEGKAFKTITIERSEAE